MQSAGAVMLKVQVQWQRNRGDVINLMIHNLCSPDLKGGFWNGSRAGSFISLIQQPAHCSFADIANAATVMRFCQWR